MPGLFSREYLALGMEVSPQAAYLVLLRKVKNQFIVDNFLSEALPLRLIVDGKIHDWGLFEVLIADWFKSISLTKKVAITLTLPSHLIKMQSLLLPKGLSSQEIEAEIAAYLAHDVPEDTLAIDYAIAKYSAASQEQENQHKVIFAATRSHYLAQYVHAFSRLGYQVKRVESTSSALIRAVMQEGALCETQRTIMAMLMVRESNIVFLIFDQEEILLEAHCAYISEDELLVQSQHQLALFYTMHPQAEIALMIVCGEKASREALYASLNQLEILKAMRCISIELFPNFFLGSAVSSTYFAVAYGAALSGLSDAQY